MPSEVLHKNGTDAEVFKEHRHYLTINSRKELGIICMFIISQEIIVEFINCSRKWNSTLP